MKFFEGLGRLIKHGEPTNEVDNPSQNDADREARLNENARQIESAIEQGHGVAADHTRLETIRGHLAEIEAKRNAQTDISPIKGAPQRPGVSDSDTIARRLAEMSKLKKPE